MEQLKLEVDKNIYDLDVVFSAAYVFLEKAYIKIDGDPNNKIIVSFRKKNDSDIQKIEAEFLNELINYANYKKKSEENKNIVKAIIQRSLLTNDVDLLDEDEDFNLDELDLDDEEVDDPEGIAIPWEEKYGSNNATN